MSPGNNTRNRGLRRGPICPTTWKSFSTMISIDILTADKMKINLSDGGSILAGNEFGLRSVLEPALERLAVMEATAALARAEIHSDSAITENESEDEAPCIHEVIAINMDPDWESDRANDEEEDMEAATVPARTNPEPAPRRSGRRRN